MNRRQAPSMTPEERTRIMEEQMHQKLAQIQQIREREARGHLAREANAHVDQIQLSHQRSINSFPGSFTSMNSANSLTPEERTRIMEIQMHQKLAQIQQIQAQQQQILERQRREREIREREAQERQERLVRETMHMVTNIVDSFR